MKELLWMAAAMTAIAVAGLSALKVTRWMLDRLTRARDEAVWWEELKGRRAQYLPGKEVPDARYRPMPGDEARAIAEQVRALHRRDATEDPGTEIRPFPRRIA